MNQSKRVALVGILAGMAACRGQVMLGSESGSGSDGGPATVGTTNTPEGGSPSTTSGYDAGSTAVADAMSPVIDGAGSATAEDTGTGTESGDGGITILASLIQSPPNRMVSDGTTLFWTTPGNGPMLFSMPVQGGPVTTLLSATDEYANTPFLAVDDVNVYVIAGNAVVRVPKNGDPQTTISESGATVSGATALGGTVYWVEENPASPSGSSSPVMSAPLLGGSITSVGSLDQELNQIAVTSSTVFVGLEAMTFLDFPATDASSPAQVQDTRCYQVTSDSNAIYCVQSDGSNVVAIMNDGTTITLGPADSTPYAVYDNAYVYWADDTTVGTITRAPKAGGGTATVVARDANPTAVAVDANAIYWSDEDGYIKSIAK